MRLPAIVAAIAAGFFLIVCSRPQAAVDDIEDHTSPALEMPGQGAIEEPARETGLPEGTDLQDGAPGTNAMPFTGSREDVVAMADAGPPSLAGRLAVEQVLTDLAFPVSWAALPDGRLVYTEAYTGRVLQVVGGSVLEKPVIELLTAADGWEQGMYGLAVHPQFPDEPYVYVFYTASAHPEADQETFVNRLVRFRWLGEKGDEVEVLLDGLPAHYYHNGGILAFGPDGKLYLSTGDGHEPARAQDPDYLGGKLLRLNPDGTVPDDNPRLDSPVYALGVRNAFGLAFHPDTQALFVTENGPECCDEVNLVRPQQNYGWPEVQGKAGVPEFADPLIDFVDSIAPTQATFWAWDGPGSPVDLFFGGFLTRGLHRLVLDSARAEEVLLHEMVFTAEEPIIGAFTHPDGALYFSTPTGLYRVLLEAAKGWDSQSRPRVLDCRQGQPLDHDWFPPQGMSLDCVHAAGCGVHPFRPGASPAPPFTTSTV